MFSDAECVGLEVFFVHDFQNFQTDRARDVVATKRAEEFHSVIKRVGDGMRRDHGADWMSIADGFPEHNDIRHDAVSLKRIEVRADATKSGLHFVCDAKTPGATHY